MQRALSWSLLVLCVALALPVLAILSTWLRWDEAALAILRHQADTVLAGYAAQSLLLTLGVGAGVVLVGGACAVAVALFEFRGRRVLEWALLLPLAMPAYVLAYAWTDALQFSSPLHTGLRELLGAERRLWPDVRSLPAAVLLFVLCLYPYVYLLARAALAERAVRLMEAARLLGAPLARRLLRVALPLARPAIAAGAALALMETLADYGVGSYFGLTTFTTGIYKAWLVMGDRTAAAQLAALLLVVVALLLLLEQRAQRRLRFSDSRGAGSAPAAEARRTPLAGAARWLVPTACALPVLLGFVLPVLWMLRGVWLEAAHGEFGLPWARFAGWAWASLKLAAIAAAAATLLALALSFFMRRPGEGAAVRHALPAAARLVGLGYAVPGAVIAVGILVPAAFVQSLWPESGISALVTGTTFGLIYAYVVRFSAVAMQSVQAGYTRVPRAMDETALTLGTGSARLFLRVHLPLVQRSALAAALLVFVDVMKELPATLVLRPFGSDTLAVVAYNLARDERLAEAALPSLAIVLVGLAPVVLLSRAMRAGR